MSIARKIGNLGTALDSAALSTFLSKGTTDGEFDTIAWGDVTGKPSYIDSSLATQLFDSAYVQARQSAVSSGGLDSAAVTSLIDSNYVAARATAASSSGFVMYNYNATSGQTAFQDSDTAGNVLSYTADGILVYYNGLLLADEDYTATDGAAVTLTEGADSGAQITIGKWNLTGSGSSSGSAAVWYGDRGVYAGGVNMNPSSRINVIQYWDMTSAGNATDFGDLNISVSQSSGVSDATLGVFGGGYDGTRSNVIDYITISTTGNASDFGDLTIGRNSLGGVSDATYGVFGGGYDTTWQDTLDYVTIQTTGNASDFGDLTDDRATLASISNTTYGLFAGGSNTNGSYNTIDYITVATTGNASDFGDLVAAAKDLSNGGADDTRGIIVGGLVSSSVVNTIQYVTISTPSNATDFGDLSSALSFSACTSNGTYVHICGGRDNSSVIVNTIQQVTVQTTGNSSDFGDLTATVNQGVGISGSPS